MPITPRIYDAIVIGTGAGGLTAGLSLAQRGRSVLLLESGKQFGGMLNPFARKRYHFDVGIHYVGEAGQGQAMRRLLDSLGLEDLRFREIDPDCIDRYVFDGYEGRLVKGRDRWADLLCADFPAERDNIRRFMGVMEAASDAARMMSKGVAFRGLRSVTRQLPGVLRALRQPLSTVLEHHFDDPRLRNIFAGPGGDIGLPPGRASGLISIMVLNHFLEGGYYPVGGSGAVRDAYVTALREHGAELIRNRRVTRIRRGSAAPFEVVTASEHCFQARSIVSNVDATDTFEMLEGLRPSWLLRRRAKRLRPSLGAFCVFVGTDLDLTQTEVTDANIWHYGSNDLDAGYAAAMEGRFSEDPFFFLTAPTLKDPETTRAPNGHHTVELITFVPSQPFEPWWDEPVTRRGPEYEALKASVSDRLLERAERYVPGLRDHIVLQESSTPATVWHFVRGRGGGIYGPEHTVDQTFLGRMPTRTGVAGLTLAGASVLGAGILTCMFSGALAGRACERHLNAESRGWRRRRPS